jgi:hypothetical protein
VFEPINPIPEGSSVVCIDTEISCSRSLLRKLATARLHC